MRIIFRIARTELAVLLFSPIAWFILILFSIISSYQFVNTIDGFVTYLDINQINNHTSLTYNIYLGTISGYFCKIVSNLYIYIPLLTMGLISKENSSGSIKLLYSSPTSSFQIIIGKFLAVCVIGLFMLLVPFLSGVCGALIFPHFDWIPFLIALCGVFLLICAYCAIGLFMSTLTKYQVVAAIGTLVVFAALKYVGQLWQSYDFIKNITYWISINGRTNDFLIGVLRTDDIIYFILVIALFLCFATLKLRFERITISKPKQVGYYALVTIIVLSMGCFSAIPKMIAVWDGTRGKLNSISENSKEILSKLRGKTTITNYVNLLDSKSHRYLPYATKMNEYIFEAYSRFKPDLYVKYVYYYNNCANCLKNNPKFQHMNLEEFKDYMSIVYNLNSRRFLSPSQIDDIVDLRGEEYTFVRIIETADGKRAFLRDFNDRESTPSEVEISATLKTLVQESPKVGFVTGHGEREIYISGDKNFSTITTEKYIRNSLLSQGFDICNVNLSENSNKLDSISILVLADPKIMFSDFEIANLDNYINKGGNIFVLTDIQRQQVINPIISKFGIHADSFQILHTPNEYSQDLILSAVDEGVRNQIKEFDIPSKSGFVSMPSAVSLTLADSVSDYSSIPLLKTPDKGYWIERGKINIADSVVTCQTYLGEVEHSLTTAYATKRVFNGKEQRIIVVGDSDFMSNAELSKNRDTYESNNFSFIMSCFKWLSNGEFPIIVEAKTSIDNKCTIGVESISIIKIIFLFIIPLILLTIVVLIRVMRNRN